MHVVPYFAPAYRYGGPPRSVLGLCQALLGAAVEVEVLTTSANGDEELPEALTGSGSFEGVPVRYLPASFPRRFFGTRGLGPALREALPEVDLVHLHGLWNLPVWTAAMECLRSGVPFLVSPRGMLDRGSMAYHRIRKELCYAIWERRYLNRAALLHATSESEVMSLSVRRLKPSIACVPNGVWLPPAGSEARARDRLGLEDGDPIVLYLGRLHPSKRLDLLIESVGKARGRLPGIRLILAGAADGPVEPLLDRGRGWCHWTGQLDDETKWSVMSAASVLVQCSDSESYGMSVAEALAAGTPVVVTRTCPWSIVEETGCGFWVEQRSDAIADAILAILRNPSEAWEMGRRGRKLAEERFSWSAIGRAMAAQYERALDSADGRN